MTMKHTSRNIQQWKSKKTSNSLKTLRFSLSFQKYPGFNLKQYDHRYKSAYKSYKKKPTAIWNRRESLCDFAMLDWMKFSINVIVSMRHFESHFKPQDLSWFQNSMSKYLNYCCIQQRIESLSIQWHEFPSHIKIWLRVPNSVWIGVILSTLL